MSLEFYEEVARLLRAGRLLAVATVVGRQGSAPRSAGARMIVTELGETEFSVGGGAFEALVIADAREAIREGRDVEKEYRFTEQGDGATGMVCGGRVRVLIEVVRPPACLFVFGGGHVVLPLLQTEVVPPGWVTPDQFIAGYGAAQIMPGPLFTFAAYLGALIAPGPAGGDLFAVWPPHGIAGALIALVAIFLPAFLVVFAALPSWGELRSRPWAQSALSGVNAAVVGLLFAALIQLAIGAIASLR